MKGVISITAAVLVAVAVAFAFTPVTFGADTGRAVAITAVKADLALIGAPLLALLAQIGDPVAQNDLGVMYMRGVGVERDPLKAAQLLNAAAAAGLARAQMNLLLQRASCNMSERADTMRKLEDFARAGDRRAASFVADCFDWVVGSAGRADITRRMLAMAEIATHTSDPDEELKFGWLLMKSAGGLDAADFNAEALRREAVTAAARYLLRAAAHGRAAAYEGISKIATAYLSMITDPALASQVTTKTASQWIETAAEAGHPRSRCAVGVKLATELAGRQTRATDGERQRLASLFQTCLKDRDPRQVILKDGREQTIGHWRLEDVWKMDEEFLITAPRYDNYDHDIVAQDDAVRRIVVLSKDL
jgi:TPR repeat protein